MTRTHSYFNPLFRFVVLPIAFAASVAPAFAQTIQQRAALQKEIARGRPLIFEMDVPGDSVMGRVRGVDQDGVEVVLGSGVRRLRFADINRVWREGDSIWNGAATGAAIVGGWCAVVCAQAIPSGRDYLGFVMRTAVTGAVFGALIDGAAKGTTTVYRRRAKVRIRGAISPRVLGVGATVSWR